MTTILEKMKGDNTMPKVSNNNLQIILNYIIENEKTSFLESECDKEHIYINALKLRKQLKDFKAWYEYELTDSQAFSDDDSNEKDIYTNGYDDGVVAGMEFVGSKLKEVI